MSDDSVGGEGALESPTVSTSESELKSVNRVTESQKHTAEYLIHKLKLFFPLAT